MDKSSIYYKILHLKFLPLPMKKLLVIGCSWFFQGLLHSDRTEKAFKVLVELALLSFILWLTSYFWAFGFIQIALSWIISHSLNYVLNGQFFVALKNIGLSKISVDRLINYTQDLTTRLKNEKSVLAACAIGSLSRQMFEESSDVDIRFIRRPGLWNGLRACFFLLLERTRAFRSRIPLDIYALDSIKWLKENVRKDEMPVILHDPEGILNLQYDRTISFEEAVKLCTQKLRKRSMNLSSNFM